MFHVLFIEQSTWFDDPDELDYDDWYAVVFDTQSDAREYVAGLNGDRERRSNKCVVIYNHAHGIGTTDFVYDGAIESFDSLDAVNERCRNCIMIDPT